MAKGLTARDLLPRRRGQFAIEGRAKLTGLLTIKLKNFPEQQILSGFRDAINRASAKVAVDLKTALDEAMKSNSWPSLSGTADIVDTGALMDSGVVTTTEHGITIAYDEPYAALVHYGGYIMPYGTSSTVIYLPPRPWIEAVLNGNGPVPMFDFEPYYRKEIENEFQT